MTVFLCLKGLTRAVTLLTAPQLAGMSAHQLFLAQKIADHVFVREGMAEQPAGVVTR